MNDHARQHHPRRRLSCPSAALAAMFAVAVAACAPRAVGTTGGAAPDTRRTLPPPPIAADSGVTNVVAEGVTYHRLFRSAGPWAIHVLEVDRSRCWMPAALKLDTSAVGRARTSALLERVRTAGDTVAAVNADFFLFTPPGVPTGAHVDDARVIAGPGARPVLAIDSAGRIHLRPLSASGAVVGRGNSVAISEWNHLPVTRLGVFDDHWGVRTDSSAGTLQVAVGREGRVLRVFRGAVSAGIPRGGWVIAAGRNAPASTRRWLASLRVGDRVTVSTALAPVHPVDAVGGFPMLLRDSAFAPGFDTTTSLARVRHPRTAVGMARGGDRLILVVVDGRQPGYSVGMTLPELARLMQEIGTTEALNLDGGGSSTMAIRASDGVRVVNRPSDPSGERPVANALAVVRGCPPR